jgi:alanyl-tRNA synthetase
MPRRTQLAQHHTAVHIINGAARKLLGNHVWQAGAGKTMEKAHLDITHYEALDIDQIGKLEKLANGAIRKRMAIKKEFMPRPEAEKRFGMRIYQGGAIPDSMVRVVNTPGWDVEACAGTHLSNTKDAEVIVILSSERIQDGVDRLTLLAGPAARKYLARARTAYSNAFSRLPKSPHFSFRSAIPKDDFKLLEDLRKSAAVFSVTVEQLGGTVKKFAKELDASGHVKKGSPRFADLESACVHLLNSWKAAKKKSETAGRRAAGALSSELLEKSRDEIVMEVIDSDRGGMIKTASKIISRDPKLTVILANNSGDLVVMSRKKDAGGILQKVTRKIGGKGGGRGELAQGRIPDPKKVATLKPKDL